MTKEQSPIEIVSALKKEIAALKTKSVIDEVALRAVLFHWEQEICSALSTGAKDNLVPVLEKMADNFNQVKEIGLADLHAALIKVEPGQTPANAASATTFAIPIDPVSVKVSSEGVVTTDDVDIESAVAKAIDYTTTPIIPETVESTPISTPNPQEITKESI